MSIKKMNALWLKHIRAGLAKKTQMVISSKRSDQIIRAALRANHQQVYHVSMRESGITVIHFRSALRRDSQGRFWKPVAQVHMPNAKNVACSHAWPQSCL